MMTNNTGTNNKRSTSCSSSRDFDFQNPLKYNIELKGKCNYHPKQIPAQEIKNFRIVSIHQQPSSHRTINPELAPTAPLPRAKSLTVFKHNRNSEEFAYISKVNETPRKKPTNPKIYQSFTFTEPNGCSHSTIPAKRREIKSVIYKQYDTTTQIINLPGATKRNANDIHDDKKPIIIPDTISHRRKIYRDYRTNISCLPGVAKNPFFHETISNKPITSSNIAKIKTDIFNIKPDPTNLNTFNVSNCRQEKYLCTDYDDTTSKQTGIKRSGKKNISQIKII